MGRVSLLGACTGLEDVGEDPLTRVPRQAQGLSFSYPQPCVLGGGCGQSKCACGWCFLILEM